MLFTKGRIEKSRELIDKGYLDAAATHLKEYLDAGLQEQSDVAHLLAQANKLDETIRGAIIALEQEYPDDARTKLDTVDGILHRIKELAKAIAQEEERLEK
jgi:hypothetical protein